MKSMCYKFLFAVGVFALLASCNKEDERPILSELLVSGYWQEELRFIYEKEGVSFMSGDILEVFWDSGGMGTHPYIEQTMLQFVKIDPQSHAIRQYTNIADMYRPKFAYYDKGYVISIDDARQTVCITAPDEDLMEKNAVAGSEMKVVSVTDNAIIFSAPIKPFIREHWCLDEYDGRILPKCDFLRMYITWIKSRYTEQLDNATPRVSEVANLD